MKQFKTMTRPFTYLILMLALSSLHAYAGGKKIIKWVDKNGVTQYGDKPPLPSKVKKSSILNKQGVTIERIEHIDTKAEDKVIAKRSRRDSALLASYNSLEEIELARQRNIEIDTLALKALEEKHNKLNAKLESNKTLLSSTKDNKALAADTKTAIERDTASIKRLEDQIKQKKLTIDKINERFESDKERYTELESKKNNINDIKHSNQNLAELKAWRADAQRRLQAYEYDNLQHTRRGTPVPRSVKEGLIRTTKELEKANDEIAAIERKIKQNKAQISE